MVKHWYMSGDKCRHRKRQAIRMFQQHGGLFSIATGREWQSIKRKNSKISQINFKY